MELTREMRRRALEPFREEWQFTTGNDEWGVTLGHWFGVAGTLYAAGEDTPERWQYRPPSISVRCPIEDWHPYGQKCPWHPEDCKDLCCVNEWGERACECTEERYYVPFLDAGETGIEMLRYAGNVLDRYASWLKRAGKDY